MSTSIPVYCAGPHITPVMLYTVTYSNPVPSPRDHGVLCEDCTSVYIPAITAPVQIQAVDGTGKPLVDSAGSPIMVDNPDRCVPGQIPTAAIIAHQNKKRDPNWTPPPHNYHEPK